MTQEIREIQVAFEKFCDDYKLNFKTQDEIELIDFFKAGVDYANWLDNLPEIVVPIEFDKPEKMLYPTKADWYSTNKGPRYFDGSNWYRRGGLYIDMGGEMCVVGRPYSWSEM